MRSVESRVAVTFVGAHPCVRLKNVSATARHISREQKVCLLQASVSRLVCRLNRPALDETSRSLAYLNVYVGGNARVKLNLRLICAELLDVALEHDLALVDSDVVLLFDFLGNLL